MQLLFVVLTFQSVIADVFNESPCANTYWQAWSNLGVSASYPCPFSANSAVAPSIKREGNLLLTNDAKEDIVFLRGVGEYNEVFFPHYHATLTEDIPDFIDIFDDVIDSTEINMIRLFVISGDSSSASGINSPFVHVGNYKLHQYNSDYFTRLRAFISKAKAKEVQVQLCLFDFSEDINSGDYWGRSAWNPNNNDHEAHFPSGLGTADYEDDDEMIDFYQIWDSNDVLNKLGLTQRDYVLKVVSETRDYPNVIYEIANEPKLKNQAILQKWHKQIAQWIAYGASDETNQWCGCTGAPEHLLAGSSPAGDKAWIKTLSTSDFLIVDFCNTGIAKHALDIYGEHNAYFCSYFKEEAEFTDYTDGMTEEFWANINNTLARGSQNIASDSYNYQNLGLMVDTDGLHRASTNNYSNTRPFGRDFDNNCRLYAEVAFIHRANFNTKEQLGASLPDPNSQGYSEDDWEKDSIDVAIESGTRLYANDDDYFGNSGFEDDWVFDFRLSKAIGTSLPNGEYPEHDSPVLSAPPLNFRPFFRYAGFREPVIYRDESTRFFGKVATVQGHIPMKSTENPVGFEIEKVIIPPSELSSSTFYQSFSPGYSPADFGLRSAFRSDGDNSFDLGVNVNELGNHLVGCGTVFNGTEPLECVAECSVDRQDWWPLVRASESSWDTSGGTSIDLSSLISQQNLVMSRKNVNEQAHRLLCQEDFSQGFTNDPDDPYRILQAGYGYSNLHKNPLGRLEFEFDIVDPHLTFDEFDNPNYNTITLSDIQMAVFGSENWTTIWTWGLNVGDFSCRKHPEGSNQDGGIISFRLSLNSSSRLGNYDFLFCKFKAKYYNGTFEKTSNIWPYLNVIPRPSGGIYLDFNRKYNANETPTGEVNKPFNTFSDALIAGEKNEPSLTNPIEYIFLDGEHTLSESDPIDLPPYHSIRGEKGAKLVSKSNEVISMGYRSRISDLNINAGVKVEHSRAFIHQVVFENVPSASAISLDGWHDLEIANCIFKDCDNAISSSGLSVLTVKDCNFLNCKQPIALENDTIAYVSNSIFYANGSSSLISTKDNSDLSLTFCGFFENSGVILDAQSTIAPFQSDNLYGTPNQTPGFVDYDNGDYHLVQSTVSNIINPELVSPCLNKGEPRLHLSGSTCIDGSRDSGETDIGYHYPESNFVYSFPRYKSEEISTSTAKTEIAIFNPTEYTQKVILSCRNMSGIVQDFNGVAAGDDLIFDLPAGSTWFRVLSESCSSGDDNCLESPCSEGSITVTSDGPLLGQYRILEDSSDGTNSWMLQMQRVDLTKDDSGASKLACDSWIGDFGNDSHSIETEIILHNLTDHSNTVTGSVYNYDGIAVPNDSFTATLNAHETRSFIFDSSKQIDFGNMEFSAESPVTGEMIYHCHDLTSNHTFSEGVILIPSSMFSSNLTAPFVQIQNYGSNVEASYICLKNPNDIPVSVQVNVFDDQGQSIYSVSTPTPTPLPIPAHGTKCLDTSEFPYLGTYSVEFDVADDKKVIGHPEVYLHESTTADTSLAGCELDFHHSTPNRFFVPYCTLNNEHGQDYEATWVVIRNNNPDTDITVDMKISSLDGDYLDSTTITLNSRESLMFTFGENPALLDPGSSKQFILAIESDDVLSGWVELYQVNSEGNDRSYDANKLHSW